MRRPNIRTTKQANPHCLIFIIEREGIPENQKINTIASKINTHFKFSRIHGPAVRFVFQNKKSFPPVYGEKLRLPKNH